MSQQDRETILVAHTNATLRARAAALLRAAQFSVICVDDGESARLVVQSAAPPQVLVADVALREPAFYELCQQIASQSIETRVLIVSSVHTPDAYKRAPTKLYGADSCVEEHRLEEELVTRVHELLAGRTGQ